MGTLAETIKEITKGHLDNNKGRLYAQCVKAVGWIGGTVPDTNGIVELPTSDVSNGGIVTGAALAGERPIYVIRYQGFMHYNMITVLNYAAKSLEMWNTPCPILVRALSMEGSMGPVASNMHHGLVMRMPGIKVVAPISGLEWRKYYDEFMSDNCPYLFSESRKSLGLDMEFDNIVSSTNSSTIYLVGSARLLHYFITKECPASNIVHIPKLKPLDIEQYIYPNDNSEVGVVVDSDYSICGAAEHIAYQLMQKTNKRVFAVGLEQRSAGFSAEKDNLTPTIKDIKKYL